MRHHYHIILALLSAAMMLLVGCSPKRSAAPALPDYSSLEGYEAIEASYRPWSRLRVPMTLLVKQNSISGVATMVRDSSINISLRMLGMEMAAIDINPDTITAVIKMNRQYVKLPIRETVGKYGFTMANLQDLITGRVFLLGSNELSQAMASAFEEIDMAGGKHWLLEPRKQPRQGSYIFAIDPDNTLSALTVTPKGGEPIGIPYTASVNTPMGVFATEAIVTFNVKGTPTTAALQWNWSKASFDNDVSVKPFSIGTGYKELDTNQLLKQLPAAK